MGSLRELFVKLGLDWDSAGFAAAISTVDVLEKILQLAVQAVQKLASVFVNAVTHTAAYGEEMEVLAQQTGFSVEAIQKLGFAASLSHSSAQELRIGLGHLSRQVAAAKGGSEEATKAFTQIGISMEEVRTLSPEQLFLRIADRMKAMGNTGNRSAYAMDLLGRSGQKLIPTLDRGSEGLQKMGIEADELNAIMTEGEIKAASGFKEGLEKLEKVFEGLQHMIAGPLIEAFTPILDAFIEWLRVNRDIIRLRITSVMQAFASVLAGMAKVVIFLVKGFDGFLAALKVLGFFVGGYLIAKFILLNALLVEQLVNIVLTTAAMIYYGYVSTAAAVKAALAWAAAAAPIVLITAALAIAALAAEDFYYFLTGGDSVIGALAKKWGNMLVEWWKPRETDSPFVKSLKQARELIEGIISSVTTVLTLLDPSGLFGKAMDRAYALGQQMAGGAPTSGPGAGAIYNGPGKVEDFFPNGIPFTPWAVARAAQNNSTSSTSHTTVHVDARGATEPERVGQAVKEAIHQVNQESLQNAAAAAGID